MNSINETTIQQLTRGQGLGALTALTPAQVIYDDVVNTIKLVFRKQVGPQGKKITHLEVRYNSVRDLYELTSYRMNRRTFEMKEIQKEM